MGKIIGPGDRLSKKEPLIFISGTFRGAEPWIEEAMLTLGSKWNPLPVAINNFDERVKLHRGFKTKLEWGDYHLRLAQEHGVVMFWFARQSGRVQANCGVHFDNPYGGNAFYDLAHTLRYKEFKSRGLVVVGCHEKYNRKNAVKDRLKLSRTGVELVDGGLEDTLARVKEMVGRETFTYLP